MCAGKWGDCCNMDGVCGTGPEFCSWCLFSVGNCTKPNVVHAQPLWMIGNTTDGTCGGKNNITCSVLYGNCCSKDSICGEDCGGGWWVMSFFLYSQILTMMKADIELVYSQDRFSRFGTCTNQPSLLQQIRMARQKEREAERQQMMECQISRANARSRRSTPTSTASTSTTTV
jgi:hypothetical protein